MADKLFPHIEKVDTLNKGRIKLNEAIDGASHAVEVSDGAKRKADEALAKSESTQHQLDTIVIEGDSSVEAAQARVSSDDYEYETLKQRLDIEHVDTNERIGVVDSKLTIKINGKANQSDVDGIASDVDELKARKSVVVSAEEPEDVDIWFEVVE